MKKSIFKKIICSLLAAAVVVTAAPEVGAITGITAEAKTKAAKITWKGAAFNKKEGIYVGKTSLQGVDGFLVFANLKASGSYWVTTNSKNLTVKMDVNSVKKQFKDKSFWVNYGDCIPFHINAKKPGTYKITVKEKYKGKTRGRKPARKNEKFRPTVLSTGDTLVELLTRCRCALTQTPDKWSERTKERMDLLFRLYPKIKESYDIVNKLRAIFRSTSLDLFSAMGHPFQQFAEMMSRSSVTSGCSLVWRRTDFRLPS